MALLQMDWFSQLLIVLDTLRDAAMTQTKLLLCLRDTFTSQRNELISSLIRFLCSAPLPVGVGSHGSGGRFNSEERAERNLLCKGILKKKLINKEVKKKALIAA